MMLIEHIYAENSARNFNYLIACPNTKQALAIDPLNAKKCLAIAKANNWQITQVINTHEHWDHTGGNDGVLAETGAELLAHDNARDTIPGVTRGLKKGDIVTVGDSVELTVLDTPGHTLSHLCLFAQGPHPALFCGDTLFNAGVGNCHNGGDPEILYHTIAEQLLCLPEPTQVYPGHDYLEKNLNFTLEHQPNNQEAHALLHKLRQRISETDIVTTIGLEKKINVFFQLNNPSLIARLHQAGVCEQGSSSKALFCALRKLRDAY